MGIRNHGEQKSNALREVGDLLSSRRRFHCDDSIPNSDPFHEVNMIVYEIGMKTNFVNFPVAIHQIRSEKKAMVINEAKIDR